ncbi:MAG: hypothetical protein WCD18_25110 [Thermosynechococcaceae cyanobacterium]
MKRLLPLFTLSTTLVVSMIPAYAGPVAPSTRGSNDPRAMCNDVGVGNNVQNNIHQQNNVHAYNQNNVTSNSNAYEWMNSSSSSSSHSAGGGGGFSIFGIGASGHGSSSSQSSNSQSASGKGSNSTYHDGSFQTYSDTSSFSDTSSSKVVVGQDCSAVVQWTTLDKIDQRHTQTHIVDNLLGW